jgi:hypothetical protein
MFTAAQCTLAKLWKQPTCHTMDRWIIKMWYICTVEYYSATKKNEIQLFAGKWMEIEIIMLNKVSQAQKDKGCMFPFMWKLGLKNKSMYNTYMT